MVAFRSLVLLLLANAVVAFAPGVQFTRVFQTDEISSPHHRPMVRMSSSQNNDNTNEQDFWAQQKELALGLADSSDASYRSDMRQKFAEQRLALLGDTAYIGLFMFCLLWSINDNPFVSISYSFGTVCGLAYAYGLGKYVETVGGTFEESSQGAGVAQARFAFLILLFIFVGKFRDQGLQELPSIAGFFTYQVASLSQAFRETSE
mmetsp:Transcript_30082/g.82623  ORF Transcript_30082/g.82623 Transcript_30082/m.82623 type:complete len:205 (+) Transcript_30082:105-719(+)